MLLASIETTAINMAKSTVQVPSRRPADPRVVAVGKAMLTTIEGMDALRSTMAYLGMNPDPILDPLRDAYRKVSDQIDRALPRLVK